MACRMIAFLALLYAVYMGALVIDGVGLYLGAIPGSHPFAITMIPAIFGATVIVIFLAVSLVPGDFDRLVKRWSHGGRLGRHRALPADRQVRGQPPDFAAGADGRETGTVLGRAGCVDRGWQEELSLADTSAIAFASFGSFTSACMASATSVLPLAAWIFAMPVKYARLPSVNRGGKSYSEMRVSAAAK